MKNTKQNMSLALILFIAIGAIFLRWNFYDTYERIYLLIIHFFVTAGAWYFVEKYCRQKAKYKSGVFSGVAIFVTVAAAYNLADILWMHYYYLTVWRDEKGNSVDISYVDDNYINISSDNSFSIHLLITGSLLILLFFYVVTRRK